MVRLSKETCITHDLDGGIMHHGILTCHVMEGKVWSVSFSGMPHSGDPQMCNNTAHLSSIKRVEDGFHESQCGLLHSWRCIQGWGPASCTLAWMLDIRLS